MKNTYRPSESGGLAWLADKGAREAKFDGQGNLVSLPEKERQGTEYERLLKGLYEAARRASAKTHAGAFISLREFMDALVDFDRAAVHQVEAGILHADQRGERGMFAPKLDTAKSTAKREEEEGADCIYRFNARQVNPPQDHTAQPPFTEEELENLRNVARRLGWPYRALAKHFWHNGFKRHFAIAEYLAKEEGE